MLFKLNKKVMLSLGVLTTTLAPISIVISCGIEEPSNKQIELNQQIKSEKVFTKFEICD